MPRLDRALLQQTLQGYATVNQLTQAARRERLRTMTAAEGLAEFEALYATWQQTGQQAGGDWAALAAQRLAHHLRLREAFAALAQRKGLL